MLSPQARFRFSAGHFSKARSGAPGKSLAAQAAEEVGLGIPYVDWVFFGWDIFELRRDYNEFEQQLNNIQQSECGCKKRAK